MNGLHSTWAENIPRFRWTEATDEKNDSHQQVLDGIIQGGIYEDLRRVSANFVANDDFFGPAIAGGLGGTKSQMHEVVEMIGRLVDHIRPLHFHAIGGIADAWNGVKTGFDTFDCVCPTRLTCHGGALCTLFLHGEKEFINLNNSGFSEEVFPIDSTCDCHCCRHFSYLCIYHLFKAKEMLGGQLLAIRNARFMIRLMETTRQSIRDETFENDFKKWTIF